MKEEIDFCVKCSKLLRLELVRVPCQLIAVPSMGRSGTEMPSLLAQRYCYDRKSRAVCAQSFALRQQAIIEFTCHDHSIIACSRHIYV